MSPQMASTTHKQAAIFGESRPRCFVIQPFDGDKFDERFDEVYAPALEAANLEPYRVDRDPGRLNRIEAIEDGLKRATMCFVDITEERPNVWYEFGFARALGKPMVIVSEKKDRYPFDVQHLHIVEYSPSAPGRFEALGKKITERAIAALKERTQLRQIASSTPSTVGTGIGQHAIACLASAASEQDGEEPVPVHTIRSAMESAGYNALATRLGLDELVRNDYATLTSIKIGDGFYESQVAAYRLTPPGLDWLHQNISQLNLQVPPEPQNPHGDEPPF